MVMMANDNVNHGAGPSGHGRSTRPGKKPKVIIVLPPSMRNINLQRLEYVAQDALDDDHVTVKDLNVQFAWLADLDFAQNNAHDVHDDPMPAPFHATRALTPLPVPAPVAAAAAPIQALPTAAAPSSARPTSAAPAGGSSSTFRVFVSNLHPDLPQSALRSLVPAGLTLVDLAVNPTRPIGPQKELVKSANFMFASDTDASRFMRQVKDRGDLDQFLVPGLRVEVSNPMPVMLVTPAATSSTGADAPADAASTGSGSRPRAVGPAPRNSPPVLSGYEPVGSWADDGAAGNKDYFARNAMVPPAAADTNGRERGANGPRQDAWSAGADDDYDWNSAGRPGRGAPAGPPQPRGGPLGGRAARGDEAGEAGSMRGYARGERDGGGYAGAYGSARGQDRAPDHDRGGASDRLNERFGASSSSSSNNNNSANNNGGGGWASNAGGWDAAADRTDRNAGTGGWDDTPAPAAGKSAWDAPAAAPVSGKSAWDAPAAWDTPTAGAGNDWATAADPWDVNPTASSSAAAAPAAAADKKRGGDWNGEPAKQDEWAPASTTDGKQDEWAPASTTDGKQDEWAPASTTDGKQDEWAPAAVAKQGGWVPASTKQNKQDEWQPTTDADGQVEWAAEPAQVEQHTQEPVQDVADYAGTLGADDDDMDFDDQGMSFEAQTAGLDAEPAAFEDQTADLDDTAAVPAAAAAARSPSPRAAKSGSRSPSPTRSPSPPAEPRVKEDPLTVTVDGLNPNSPSSQVLSLLGSHVPVDVIPTPLKRFGGPDGPQMRGAKFVFDSVDEAEAFAAHVRELIEEGRTAGVEAPGIGLMVD